MIWFRILQHTGYATVGIIAAWLIYGLIRLLLTEAEVLIVAALAVVAVSVRLLVPLVREELRRIFPKGEL